MDSFRGLIDLIQKVLDVDGLIQWGGVAGVTGIIFVETGLFFGFFLPGDSLLVTAGIIAAADKLDIRWLIALASLAAIVGDQVGYVIGRRAGSALRQRYARFDKHLDRAHAFYEKYGSKTIVIARFVPIVRTFVPAVAGAAQMNYRRFVTYNIAGGLLWVWGMTLAGYSVGKTIPNIKDYLHIVIVIVVVLSLLPAAYEWRKHRRASL
ncbi:MAG TPA: VTT domain-containing protein [Terriglobia bacterium]|nr:VTT domain-containing protein [Terriglobia bacterium]